MKKLSDEQVDDLLKLKFGKIKVNYKQMIIF